MTGGVPLLVRLRDQRVLCVGAGPVAKRKLRPLLADGAAVHLVAPEAVDALRDAAAAGRLRWSRRRFELADLDGVVLAVAATASAEVNAAVAEEAARRGVVCVRSDGEGQGSADLLATVRRGPLTIAVSTSGDAPSLARLLRQRLEAEYGPEWGALVALFGEARRDPAVRERMGGLSEEERQARWRSIPVPDTLGLLRAGNVEAAKRTVTACLSSSSD